MSLRVVHVVPALFGYEGVYGGAERYALELARAVAERVPTKLVSFGAREATLRDGRLKIRVVQNLIPYRRFQFDPISPGLLLELSWADVVHYHQTNTFMASIAALAMRLRGRKIFATPLGGAGLGIHNWMDVSHWYDGHLHITDFSKKAYGGTSDANYRVIGAGVDTDLFCPADAIPSRDFVLFAGRLLPHKGINYLVEAVDADQKLVIAGRPWKHARGFLDLLHRLAANKNVQFVSDASDSDLIDLYRNALCVVLPSVYETYDGAHYSVPELLGQTLLEAMSCGTPAICTAVGGMPEVVEDGVSGFVVPPNDPKALGEKLRWLRSNPALAARMGEAARKRVLEHFSWKSVVDRCLASYSGGTS